MKQVREFNQHMQIQRQKDIQERSQELVRKKERESRVLTEFYRMLIRLISVSKR
jgi:hypothetical protein